LAVAAALVAVSAADRAPAADRFHGPVVGQARVIEGDRLVVDGVEVFLFGIDAPDWHQWCETRPHPRWRCGRAAAEFLKQTISGRPVRCDPVTQDRYGRILGRCRIGIQDLAEKMVRSGLAVVTEPATERYVRAERLARNEFRGLWSGPFGPPREYRNLR
jgi:endonuclease YncB( thermonuclease family)